MRIRRPIRFAIPFAFAAGFGCSDTTGIDNLNQLVLDFCSGSDTPVLAAVKNEGQPWTRVTPDASGTIVFRASDRVGLAFVYQFGASTYTDVIYASVAELDPLANAACPEQLGSKTLNGSVASVSGSAVADVSMASESAALSPQSTTFSLSGIPSVPLDLIASRSDLVGGVYTPNRIIVRRSLNLLNGASIPVLDFGAAEALAPATNTVAIAGISPNDNSALSVDFSTATTTHNLYTHPSISGSSQTIYGAPASLTQSGDLHILDVTAQSTTGSSYRVAQLHYQLPADKAMVLGATVNAPTVSTLSGAPALLLETSLPSQSDYPWFATATHYQGARTIAVTVTADYLGGTPSTWVMDIPDLSGVSGYSVQNYALQPGLGADTYVDAY